MIQRANSDYFARLFVKAPAGFWHLHLRGIEPFIPKAVALDRTVAAEVHHGRWVVECPHCAGAQLAAPETDRFLCVDCANVAVDGAWLRVVWPDSADIAAVEAALLARPDVATRGWRTDETIGFLLFENAQHGLVDIDAGTVNGDIGASHSTLPGRRPELSR